MLELKTIKSVMNFDHKSKIK